VYATTEPLEALQLGGRTALLAEGRVLQSGPTLEVFRRPATLEAARAFSDPPLNVIPATVAEGVQLPTAAAPASDILLGVRAHEFSLAGAAGQLALRGRVELAEISGSETFIHLARDDVRLVAQIPGVHDLPLNEPCTLYVRPASLYGFDRSGRLLFAPEN
jgi:glycerol transport system ATP-binding protein